VFSLWFFRHSPLENTKIQNSAKISGKSISDPFFAFKTALSSHFGAARRKCISEAAHEAPTIRALCDGVRGLIGELFPESAFFLILQDPDTGALRSPDWHTAADWTEQALTPGTGLSDVTLAKRPLLATVDPTTPGVGIADTDGANWLGVPMTVGERLLGALVIETREPRSGYDRAIRICCSSSPPRWQRWWIENGQRSASDSWPTTMD